MPYKHIQNYFSFSYKKKKNIYIYIFFFLSFFIGRKGKGEAGSNNSGLGNSCHWASLEVPQKKLFYLFLSLIWETCVNNKQCTLFIHIINFTFCKWTLNGGLHTICNFGATSQQQPQRTRTDLWSRSQIHKRDQWRQPQVSL